MEMLRLGTNYGGWLIPAESGLSSSSICYCAGAGEDISFDCELVKRYQCMVRIIDPTPRAIEHFRQLSAAVTFGTRFYIENQGQQYDYGISKDDLHRLCFLPVGLADQDAELKFYMPKNPKHVSCSIPNLQHTSEFFVAQCHRLKTIMDNNGDSFLDLLKIDIEGAEYGVIRDMINADVLPRILLIEFDEVHSPLDESARQRIEQHMDLLAKAGMRCISIENSNATFVRVKDYFSPSNFGVGGEDQTMKLLNVGCGSTFHPAWINIDLVPSDPSVKQFDIRKGIPFPNDYFEAVYSSHMIEHLRPQEAEILLTEAVRVAKPGGVVRLATPDLERMVKDYLDALERAASGEAKAEADYDWMMLELYDQVVRDRNGGRMLRFLSQRDLGNKDFILRRVGTEAMRLWESNQGRELPPDSAIIMPGMTRENIGVFQEAVTALRKIVGENAPKLLAEALFRNQGEIHCWMYDRFSLGRLMKKAGIVDIRVCAMDESRIPNFNSFGLDMKDSRARKPDSIFIEGVKP